MMPLSLLKPGNDVLTISKVGGKDETRRHLAGLGFVAGARVSIVSEAYGNLILSVKGTRVALDRALAKRIFVQ